MRLHHFISAIILILLLNVTKISALSVNVGMQSVIIEVEGNPAEHEAYFKKNYPYIEVIARYDLLFNGLALKIPTGKVSELTPIDFIKAIHDVQMYETSVSNFNVKDHPDATIPADLNTTPFTGEGVKIAVIDTGIDYDHPDLAGNYRGGYDVVDLDDDPMETVAVEGIPTIHGTHVAGIIAANGKLKGVAPGSEIYAYRALGPGGKGSTVQIIAAMEQAIKDGVDIMNLSLGNTVNGPDYPTSIAVNRAIDLGVAVVIANGNNGPDNWTVGSPATASKAFSVGASSKAQKIPILYDAQANKYISLFVMGGSIPWKFVKDFQVVIDEEANVTGKIALIKRGKTPFYEMAKKAEENGAVAVLIYNNEIGELHGSIENEEHPITIPVAGISSEAGKFLEDRLQETPLYLNTVYHEIEGGIASFSSRGPVTINWQIKPDILAPGTAVLSTVPGNSYLELQGTSMAAPHVAGAIAIVKEAQPNWTNEQIIGALKTTALQLSKTNGEVYDPIEQGAGEIQIKEAINTKTIISDSLLTFKKVERYNETKTVEITIENTTNKTQDYYFDMPKQKQGLVWKLPHSFSIEKNEVKKVSIELNITSQQLEEAIHQGWLTLNQANEKYHLPYVFINKTADFAKTSGFQFALKIFSEDLYSYRLHVADHVKRVDIHLYDPDTLVYQGKLLTLTDLDLGINEGEIERKKIKQHGIFKALLSVELANGSYETHETDIYIE